MAIDVEVLWTKEPTSDTLAVAPAEAARATSIVQTAEQQRKATLDRALLRKSAEGWRLMAHSDFQATITKGNRLNNTLHLILTIITVGLWGIIWILLAIRGRTRRRLITVDEYGNVIDNKF